MRKTLLFLGFFMGICLLVISCKSRPGAANAQLTPKDTVNVLTAQDSAVGWQLLWDGKTFAGWHNFNKDTLVGWKIENGELISLGLGGDHANDIVTNKDYTSFELSIEWKASPKSNSGIFYYAVEGKHDEIYAIAPEYQLIDEKGWPDKLEEWQKAGACYGMYVADSAKELKPVGQFNLTKIIVNNGHVEHWLNGKKVVEYTLWSDDWKKRIKEGKWKDYPDYSSAHSGKIGLQDHGNSMYFRNIKIKVLP